MSAANYHQDNYDHYKSPRRLLPKDPIGQRFVKYFHHGWSFIEAPTPPPGQKPNWRTETRYPIEPRNLWSKYQDEGVLMGISLPSHTNYMLLDVDRGSAYHPENNQKRFDGILGVLEEIGLCRDVSLRSSESEGIHVYHFLPFEVHSFTLAITIKQALAKEGYFLRNGQLEIFPNPKPYNKAKPTSFKSHRLPLQKGSFLLDWDLHPISNDVVELLDRADWAAEGQDMETLGIFMQGAREWYNKEYWSRRGKSNAEQFCFDLQEVISQGWTGFGQTNDLLLIYAKYGIVFLRLSGEALVRYMLEAVQNAPGYSQFCRHQHEIEYRIRAWAVCAENYPYVPYPGNPPRNKTFREHFGQPEGNIIVFPNPSRERHERTLERITAVVRMLKLEGRLPPGVYRRAKAIIAKSQETHGLGVSQSTLYKEEYLPLWHPGHEKVEGEEGVNPDSAGEKYSILPDPWFEPEEEENPGTARVSESLHVLPIYESPCLPPARGGGDLGNGGPENINDQAGSNGGSGILAADLTDLNLSNNEKSTIFLDLIILKILSTTTINPNSSDPNCFNSLIQAIEQSENESYLWSITEMRNTYLLFYVYFALKSEKFDKLGIIDKWGLLLLIFTVFNGIASERNKRLNAPPPDKPSPPSNLYGQKDTTSTDVADPEAPTGDEETDNPPTKAKTVQELREATRLKLQFVSQARKKVQMFCSEQGIYLITKTREALEQFVKHCLMRRSPSPVLQQEAQAWFIAHSDLVAQIRSFAVFWDYFQDLQ